MAYIGNTAAADLMAAYNTIAGYMETDNCHGEAVALMALLFGEPEDLQEAAAINAEHIKAGYLTPELHERRSALCNKLRRPVHIAD